MNLKEITKQRRTVKVYDETKTISNDIWDEIVEFGYNSPTSMNWQTWRALVIDRGSELHNKLGDDILIFNVDRAKGASKIVLFITPEEDMLRNTDFGYEMELNNLKLAAKWKGEEFDSEKYPEEVIRERTKNSIDWLATDPTQWAARQAYIGASYMTIAAASHKVDSTFMEGFVGSKMKELLVKEGYMKNNENATLLVAFGYRDENSPMKPTNRVAKEIKFTNAK